MAKSTMKRLPKGMGHYFMTPTGKYAWRKRSDKQEKYLSADTPDELQKLINEVIDLKITKSKLKVDEWFTQWLKYIEGLRKPATYNQYKDIYSKHVKPQIGSKRLSSIKSHDIQSVILTMNKATTKTRKKVNKEWVEVDTGKTLSTWTMKHARKIMNLAFEKAVKDKMIPENPVKDIEIPKKQSKPRKTLNSEELAKLFRQLERSRWIWSAKFMLITGMRRGELLALRWSDIDYINRRITIDESDSSTGLDDTKSSKVHYVPFSPLMKKYLEGQKQMLKDENNAILENEELKKSDLVFPSQDGVMLQPGSYYTMLARYASDAGIKASPHCLRHTFVYMNRKKLSLKEIQNILGHDESTTTLDIYGDMIDESTEQTGKDIDETFSGLDESISKYKENELAKIIDFAKRRKIGG